MDGENNEWQAPPIPEQIRTEDTQPQMSELATLGNIFIEPGRTFEDLRRKPRFVWALLITILLTTVYAFSFYYKVGDEGFKRFAVEQIDKSPQAANMNAEQKDNAIKLQLTIMNGVRYALPIFIIIGVAIGGLIYWLAGKAFGGSGNYLHGVSTWVYSSFPPTIIAIVANMIILAFKSVDEIDIATSQRGLIQANPGMFLDGKSMPVLATLISVLDLFAIWGWILASIGLQKTNKISSGSAWTITIILALVGIAFRVIGALLSGNPS
jgi:Yip1 domain